MRIKMILKFPNKISNTPITYDLIKKFDLRVNILKADINYKLEGYLVFDIDGNSKQVAEALTYLEEVGVDADLITNTIDINRETCVDCGLCTGACTVRALNLNRQDWTLNYTEERCVGCNRCVGACPTRSITNAMW